ncbi:unnamed protein product [Lota lota]
MVILSEHKPKWQQHGALSHRQAVHDLTSAVTVRQELGAPELFEDSGDGCPVWQRLGSQRGGALSFHRGSAPGVLLASVCILLFVTHRAEVRGELKQDGL